jgi:hypothetical protein
MAAHTSHPLFVAGSLTLTLATIACGISFFGPYWLQNVTKPAVGREQAEPNFSYLYKSSPTYRSEELSNRGLWAQCGQVCQWFWEDNYRLQTQKFSRLTWHLATQVLYFVGAFLVLFCEVYSRVQICCRQRRSIYRSIGFLLLSSFVIQSAAVAVFGGFSNRDYGAGPSVSSTTYLGWCFWMTIAGGGMTLLSGILFLFIDCTDFDDYDDK